MGGSLSSKMPARLAAACALLAASTGLAAAENAVPADARLTNVQGTVLVDRGTGFVRVLGDAGLRLGDRVMVTDGGGAFLDFGENCAFPLEAPSMTTVTQHACSVSTQSGGSGTALVVAGVGVVGVGGFILFNVLNGDDDDDDEEQPVSP
jgi:hypothetical protein